MPIQLGDIAKLFKKNIHVSAQTRHFKQLADGDFVLVRVKNIEHRGEARQRKLHATVTWPARLQEGEAIVWEGITLLKNLVLEEAAPVAADAPGADSSPAKRPAVSEPDLDQIVSDGDSDRVEEEEPEMAAVAGPREGWKWAPCTIDGRADESAFTTPPAFLFGESFDVHSPYEHFAHYLWMVGLCTPGNRTPKATSLRPCAMWLRRCLCEWSCAAAKKTSSRSRKSFLLTPDRSEMLKSCECANLGLEQVALSLPTAALAAQLQLLCCGRMASSPT
jgi:hypothetical protein